MLSLPRLVRFAGLLCGVIVIPPSTGCRRDPEREAADKAQRDYERTRDALLARGDPNLMRPAPVHGLGAPSEKLDAQAIKRLVRPLSDTVLEIDALRIDLEAHSVEIPAAVALKEGILEYLVVTISGKAYESAFTADVVPLHLRLALTLAGFEEATPDNPRGGDAVRVLVRYANAAGKEMSVPATALLVDRRTGRAPPALSWRFTGSDVHDGQVTADSTGSLVATRFDPTALVNATLDTGNPYEGPQTGLGVNKAVMPAVGTPVRLLLVRETP